VASRHENNEGTLPLPDEAWLERMPRAVRVGVLANFVQHAADTGTPDPCSVEEIALRFLVPVHDAFPVQLKLLGALGRLLAATRRVKEALELQETLAGGFFAQLCYADVSFPLTEWYRLAGVCNDADAFRRAEAMRALVDERGGFGFDGSPFVDLGRCRAMVLLGRRDAEDPEWTLARLAADGRIAAHVRWSAARWLVRVFDGSGRSELADDRLAEMEAAAAGGPGAAVARRFLALARLDRALGAGDRAAAAARADDVRTAQPGLTANLLAGVPEGDRPRVLATLYPY
jgi:hypothetical protein